MKEKISPYAVGSATCSCMKQPKPERFVVTLGMPITVHSAAREWTKEELQTLSIPTFMWSRKSPVSYWQIVIPHPAWYTPFICTHNTGNLCIHSMKWCWHHPSLKGEEIKAWGVDVTWPLRRIRGHGKAGPEVRHSVWEFLLGPAAFYWLSPAVYFFWLTCVPLWACDSACDFVGEGECLDTVRFSPTVISSAHSPAILLQVQGIHVSFNLPSPFN